MMTRVALVVAGVVCCSGCIVQSAGPTQHDFRTLELDKSEWVTLDLSMGAGDLRVGSGTSKLMRADFAYNVPSWKPYVRYSSTAGHGSISIEQPKGHPTRIGNHKYEWDLRLNRDMPIDVRVHFGAGEARLDLGSLSLRGVDVEMGVGKLDLDLRGTLKRSYDVRIRGGVGEAVVRLPRDVGALAHVEGGIGSISVSGFHNDGNRYYNEAYKDSKSAIRLDVRGGIGSIRLISD